MNGLLIVGAIFVATLLSACSSASKTARNAQISEASLAALNTTELEARRTALKSEIASIEREVEMKAGLHMGVGISDERGRLSDLYRETNLIERELLRRSAYSKL